jgi:CO/xanthine dehydrogenase Mo-binding subunit
MTSVADRSGYAAGDRPDTGTLEALRRPEQRIEGVPKVTGAAAYVPDIVRPGMLHAAFLGSSRPHARIVEVDTRSAAAIPGVRGIIVGADVRGMMSGARLLDRPVLAWDRVRFVGDRVAAVAADTPEAAAAAVAAIEVEFEDLPAILDVEAALAPDAPVLHPDAASYAYEGTARPAVPHPNVQGRLAVRRGADDIDAVFASAARVVEGTWTTPRQHAGAMEPHACLVWLDEDGRIRVLTTNKSPFPLRSEMARSLGVPADSIVVQGGIIGGDFGGKAYSIDEVPCALLARLTGRPVRAVTEPGQELGETNVRHAAVLRLRTAVDAAGNLLAHQARILLDGGAYAAAKPLPHLNVPGSVRTLGGYRCPNVDIESLAVYTNTVPGGPMRAPGDVQAGFAGESQLDELAEALREDRLRFRLRNAVREGEVAITGQRYRETRAAEVLEAAAEAIEWDRTRPTGVGVGIAVNSRRPAAGKMTLKLRLHADGAVEVITGVAEPGVGTWQVVRRAVAAGAGVAEDRVAIQHAATDVAGFDPGVGGSRMTHVASNTGVQLGGLLREWLLERLPRAIPDAGPAADLAGDRFVDRGAADGEETRDLGGFTTVVAALVDPAEPVELATSWEANPGPDEPEPASFVACAVEAAVDAETGSVTIRDAVLAVDVGTVFNPVAHLGQLEGGFVYGLGGTMMEEVRVENGAVTSRNLDDLKLPSMRDAPPLRVIQLPTVIGPGAYGAKMAGELTNTPVAAAIANAIADASGARVRDLPLSAERVLRVLRQGNQSDPRTAAPG